MRSTLSTPPVWAERCLQAWLPNDSMRDAIMGDLYEELVRDAHNDGRLVARRRYRQRVAGILAYALLDTLRWRTWGSTPADVPRVQMVGTRAVASTRARPRTADAWIVLAAFAVLGVGIVANTLIFSTVRTPAAGASVSPALGVVAIALALGSALAAAVLLCVGPRWLRQRACHRTTQQPH